MPLTSSITVEDSIPEAKPCPHCGAAALIQRDPRPPRSLWFVACSNELDCPVWPVSHWYASVEAAVAAWNSNDVI